ncbi:MAG: hypothetical protein RR615_12855, partial [Morganella sp. (in: enterobacteria)]
IFDSPRKKYYLWTIDICSQRFISLYFNNNYPAVSDINNYFIITFYKANYNYTENDTTISDRHSLNNT